MKRMVGILLAMALSVLAESASASPAERVKKDKFELHVLCDFWDDLHWGEGLNEKQLREFIGTFKSWGVTRICWMGDTIEDGTYDLDMPLTRKAAVTYKQIGEFIPAAIKVAHEMDMEFYVQMKPFDQAMPILRPHGVKLKWLRNSWRKGLPALGGTFAETQKTWLETHPQFLMARNMTGIREGIEKESIGTLKIIKKDDKPTGIQKDNLQIYVSTDNCIYRKYDKPFTFHDAVEERPIMIKGVNLNRPSSKKEKVRVLTLSGLDIKEPYLALSTKTKTGAPDFANVYYKLIEMYTIKNEAMPFTYGPYTATNDWMYYGTSPLGYGEPEKVTFPNRGFAFGISGYLGTVWHPEDLLDEEVYLDGDRKVIGLAKGKNPYITALCPVYPEVKQNWLNQVKKFIDWGADGVDFRWPGHQDTIDWAAYGFNKPVVEEFQKRYGVNILTQEFDRDKWRKLMGDHYTDFYRQAKALLAKHGRKMQVDVLAVDDPNRKPPLQYYCNVFNDWPTWFSFADSVTLRRYHRDFDIRPFQTVAEKYNLPTYYSIWSWVIWEGLTPKQISEKVQAIWAAGNNGLILYETGALYRIKPDGTFYQPRPELVKGTLDFKAKLEALRQERKKAADRRRRIIFNNDGDDAVLARIPTTQAFLAARTTPLLGSQVDTIFYSTQGSLGYVNHNTKVGQAPSKNKVCPTDISYDLISQGTDCVKVMVDHCRKNKLEIFWSMRMNDTHEALNYDWSLKVISQFKKDHPEYLFGTPDRLPKYGFWAAVDYRYPEVRDFAFRMVQEVCRNYNIDGIELDFFRWLQYFKSVADGGTASNEELAMMTDLVKRIRIMTEEEGLKRGRPILVAIRVPDSVGYCRAIGIDLERWLSEGLLDILIPAGDFQLNSWPYSVQLGHKYDVKVYCDLDPCYQAMISGQFDRNGIESYRARAMDAWHAGSDGIYIFNNFNPRHPIWWELGDPVSLAAKDKVYFPNVTGNGSWHRPDEFLADGERFRGGAIVHPHYPQFMIAGKPLSISVSVGDNISKAVRDGREPEIECYLRTCRSFPADRLVVELNGTRLEQGIASENWIKYAVNPGLVKQGDNQFDITLKPETNIVKETLESWDMIYHGNKILTFPEQAPWRRLFDCKPWVEEIRNDTLFLADRGTGKNDLVNLVYEWKIAPGDETIVEARVKVVSSSNPLGVCLRLANGTYVDYLTLEKGRIGLKYAGLSFSMDTTSAFHTYRTVLKNKDIKVYVDGLLKLDGSKHFATSVEDPGTRLPYWPAASAGQWPHLCSLLFGSASGPGTGEAYWEFIRFRTQTPTLVDLVMPIRYPKQASMPNN